MNFITFLTRNQTKPTVIFIVLTQLALICFNLKALKYYVNFHITTLEKNTYIVNNKKKETVHGGCGMENEIRRKGRQKNLEGNFF